jgi:hypothetical protein
MENVLRRFHSPVTSLILVHGADPPMLVVSAAIVVNAIGAICLLEPLTSWIAC